MGKKLIGAAVLFGIYHFAGKNNVIKAMVLGVAGIKIAAFVPYVNDLTPSETLTAIKGA